MAQMELFHGFEDEAMLRFSPAELEQVLSLMDPNTELDGCPALMDVTGLQCQPRSPDDASRSGSMEANNSHMATGPAAASRGEEGPSSSHTHVPHALIGSSTTIALSPPALPLAAAKAASASRAAAVPETNLRRAQHVSHSTVEKQRRDRINFLIDELRDLVPPQAAGAGVATPAGPPPTYSGTRGGADGSAAAAAAAEARRPKHVVLADTISLLKSLRVGIAQQQHLQHLQHLQRASSAAAAAANNSGGGVNGIGGAAAGGGGTASGGSSASGSADLLAAFRSFGSGSPSRSEDHLDAPVPATLAPHPAGSPTGVAGRPGHGRPPVKHEAMDCEGAPGCMPAAPAAVGLKGPEVTDGGAGCRPTAGLGAAAHAHGMHGHDPAGQVGTASRVGSLDGLLGLEGIPLMPNIPMSISSFAGVTVERALEPGVMYVQVKCRDRRGLLSDIINALKMLPVEIRTAAVVTSGDGMVRDVFEIRADDPDLTPDAVQNVVHDGLYHQLFCREEGPGKKHKV